MGNFIGMVYSQLKEAGVDTSDMDTNQAIDKWNAMQEKEGKFGSDKPTDAESKRMQEMGIEDDKKEIKEPKKQIAEPVKAADNKVEKVKTKEEKVEKAKETKPVNVQETKTEEPTKVVENKNSIDTEKRDNHELKTKGTPAEQKRMRELDGETSNEVGSGDDKANGLAKHLGLDNSNIKQSSYDENVYETDDGEEYLVVDEDKAYEYAKEDIKNLFDDIGMDSFGEDFQDWIYDNAIDEDYFDELLEEEMYYYTEEEPDEDMQNMIRSYEGNGKQYVEDNFGKDELRRMIKEKNLVDIDKVAEEAINWDGVAHFIARYDGEEIDLGNGMYAYRQN